MKKNILVTIFLTLLVSSPLAVAKKLHVSTQGNGSNCSSQQPCGRIQTAIDIAEPGDNIKVLSGQYTENITIPAEKTGLVIEGGRRSTLISAGGQEGKEAPAGTPADIIVDIFAENVVLKHLIIRHPKGEASKRDIGIFVRPLANNVMLRHLKIQRLRTDGILEPTTPGSRGVLVFRATGAVIKYNRLKGNYEDHLHIPASKALILQNHVVGAIRDGIAIIQEPPGTDGISHPTIDNIVIGNRVIDSGDEGLEVQGDETLILHNLSIGNMGNGLLLCGENSECNFPGGVSADASENFVYGNLFGNNNGEGLLDEGSDNIIKGNNER